MNDQEKRIKLAEAIGWTIERVNPFGDSWQWIDPAGHMPDKTHVHKDAAPSFYPFTDANDDYAVLEWMRKERFQGSTLERWAEFIGALESPSDNGLKASYKIGDYARAALKVIT